MIRIFITYYIYPSNRFIIFNKVGKLQYYPQTTWNTRYPIIGSNLILVRTKQTPVSNGTE